MNSSLKRRLVGATVLVALGVIFIPMILERGTEDARLSVRMEIPPQPDIEFLDPSEEQPEQETIKPLPSMQEALEPIKSQQSSKNTVVQEKPVKAGDNTKSHAVADKVKNSSAKQQWVVQIGSFSRAVNAEVLKDKLVSAGFDAYVESAKASTGPVHRVRVGPVDDRETAEFVVKKLDSKGGYRGIVMSYAK